MDEPTPRVTLLQQREIEARIVAPIIAEVRRELGDERTAALLRRVIERLARESGAELARSSVRQGLAGFAETLDRWTEGGALEIELLEQTDETLDFNVTRCRYAEMYHRLGIGDLGEQLSCCRDSALAGGFDPGIALSRTQTILEGAPFCDFRFRKAHGPEGSIPSPPCNPEQIAKP